MKTILKVGYEEILLPDIATASKVMALLEKGISVRDHMFEQRVKILGPIEMSIKTVAAGTKFLATDPETGEADEKSVVLDLFKQLPRPSSRRLLNG